MAELIDIFTQKQQRINDFVRRANTLLPTDNPLYFDGHFITGQTDHPDILFIGINPGHRDWDNIEGRLANTHLVLYQQQPCKYIAAAAMGNRFARRVIDVVCDGEVSRLRSCAETSLLSYFASPTERVVKAQLKQLPKEMQVEHRQLTQLPVKQINPRHIVCIGWRTFDEFLIRYVQGFKDTSRSLPTKKLPICMQGIDKMMDYYTKIEWNGIIVHGVRHFSTPLSRAMLDDMNAIFQDVWASIDCDRTISKSSK
ncbi:hypothetical protein [uncultured Psychrobacter sp.]|uniref:hypothetical protein n=1 Tax=uncultured Psychrobacter sp. TaxID=259303 RepID=UPI003457C97A